MINDEFKVDNSWVLAVLIGIGCDCLVFIGLGGLYTAVMEQWGGFICTILFFMIIIALIATHYVVWAYTKYVHEKKK